MTRIRWGIVGPGNIARKFAEAIKNAPSAELCAVASRSYEKGKSFAEKYNIPLIFGNYEEMAGTGDIDAVYIATPHPFHKPCAELFLKAGKHVLCEKPVCLNVNQATELKNCAEAHGVFLMEAMWTRFLPAIKELGETLKSGVIGEVLGIKADFCYNVKDTEHKIYRNDMAGGSLLDVGIYGLNFAAVFLGTDPTEISAVSNVAGGVDRHTNVLLKYKNGAIAEVSSAINVKKPEDAYIYGTEGYIFVPNFFAANKFTIHTADGEQTVEKPFMGNGFEEEIIEACDCIKFGKTESGIMPMSESIKILGQMDIIRKQINVKYPYSGEE